MFSSCTTPTNTWPSYVCALCPRVRALRLSRARPLSTWPTYFAVEGVDTLSLKEVFADRVSDDRRQHKELITCGAPDAPKTSHLLQAVTQELQEPHYVLMPHEHRNAV